MRFDFNYNAEPIADLKIDINSDNSGLLIKYSVPADEFKKMKTINYNEEIVVFNSDEREVLRESFDREIHKTNGNINQQIKLKLLKGEYNLAMKIKDNHSNKMGIYKFNSRIE
jgi:hypothetical protein